MPILAENRKLKFNYEILEDFEAGIILTGGEVKSLRIRGLNLASTYILINRDEKGRLEALWRGAQITAYQPKNVTAPHNSERDKKILLTKKEIDYLFTKSQEKGLTLMPVMLYTKKSFIKMKLALVRGKKNYDKRESIKKREVNRKINSELKLRG